VDEPRRPKSSAKSRTWQRDRREFSHALSGAKTHRVGARTRSQGRHCGPGEPEVSSCRRSDYGARAAASALGVQLSIINAGNEREIDTAFATSVERRADALLVASDPFFFGRREQLVTLAARHALPAGYFSREFATAGGLMSYGASISDAYRQTGIYTS
jgi:hypothetical protein